jgi:hypothetical protein
MITSILFVLAFCLVVFFVIYLQTLRGLSGARIFVFSTGELIPISHIEKEHDKPIVAKDGRRFGYLEAAIRYV